MKTKSMILASLIIMTGILSCTTEPPLADSKADAKDENKTISWEDRLNSLDKELENNPANWALYQDRSQIHFRLKNVDAAIRDIQEAIKLHDSDPDLHYLRGYYAMAEGDSSLALSQYRLAAGHGSLNPDNYYQIGQMLFFKQNYEQALKSYQEAARIDSLDPLYPFAMGFMAQNRQMPTNANAFYMQALRLNPTHEKTLLQLHDLYLEQFKDEKKALAWNLKVLNQKNTHSLANYNLANSHYRRALKLAKDGTVAYQQAYNDAVTHYSIAINKGKGTFAEPYFYRALCYIAGKKHQKALEDLQKAVEISPDHSRANFYLGSIHEYFGDANTALKFYKKSLQLDSDFREAKQAVKELSQS